MRIGCLQFAPQVGDVDNNLNRADEILDRASPEDLDLLILPELAFTGYNFKTLRDIHPFLEPTGSGITSVWARTTALKYNCAVAVGYPETADVTHKWPTSPEYYNSLIMVNEDGDAWALYRKSHLYYTDESWALEGPDGFWKGHLPGVGKIAMGICMDINPYRFEAPWNEFEFATHALKISANVVVVSMAWLTHENRETFLSQPKEPDMDTLTYWVKRMEPLIRCESEEEIIVIFANRSGTEDEVLYAGTSAVLGIQGGEVTVYGLLGRGENELLVVDTSKPGLAKLVYRPEGEADVSTTNDAQNQPHYQPEAETASHIIEDEHGSTIQSDTSIHSGTDVSALQRATEVSLRAGGHVLIPSDTIDLKAANFPSRMYDGSPISPRYFWSPPRTDDSGCPPVPSFGVNSTYEEWRTLLSESNGSFIEEATDDLSPAEPGSEPTAEFSALIKGLSHSEAAQEAAVSRPFSTKSRNAGRDHQSRSTNQASYSSKRVRNAQSDHGYASQMPENSCPRAASTEKNSSRYKARSTTPGHRAATMTPDLEKLGADLMVFEKEDVVRQKRDSLVCHVDDDDYIVLQTARKDGKPRQQKSAHSTARTSRPSSRQTPRQLDVGVRQSSRSDSRGLKLDRESAYDSNSHGMQPHSHSRDKHRTAKYEASTPSESIKKMYSQSRLSSNVHSPSSRQSRRESGQDIKTHSLQKSPPPILEQVATVAARESKHRKQDLRSSALASGKSSNVPIIFSPDMVGISPEPYAFSFTNAETPETEITIPDTVRVTFPPTPKAMVLEEKFGEETAAAPTLDNAMERMAVGCQREAAETAQGRPRSAVW